MTTPTRAVDRRGRAALCLVALSLTVLATDGAYPLSAARGAAASRPNVLIVVTDDQPVGMMDALPFTKTWLGSGARFTNAVANTPLCCPARATILSGRYTHNHGVRTLDHAYELDAGESMVPALRGSGYRTAMAGKYLNGWNFEADDPHGFDRFALVRGGYSGSVRYDDGSVVETEDTIATVHDAALDFLSAFEADDASPWMLYLAPFAPHSPSRNDGGEAPPLRVTPPMEESDLSDKPPHVRDVTRRPHTTGPRHRGFRQMFLSLAPVDRMMQAIHARLEEMQEAADTLVIFTSDNGYLLGQHLLTGKREPYDGSVRVPLYLWWPGRAPAGRDPRITGLVDVAPTVYEATGVIPGYVVDGISMLGAATRSRILIEHYGGGSFDHGFPRWQGWWSPSAMYRRNIYRGRGTAGCSDTESSTLCQMYADAPGQEELYDRRQRLKNLLQRGVDPRPARDWVVRASSCAGSECHQLEAEPIPQPSPPRVRVRYEGPTSFTVGQSQAVTVVARNVSDRVLRDIEVQIEPNSGWRAVRLTDVQGTLRPGEALRTRWRIGFHGGGFVSLSAFVRWRGGRAAWDAAPLHVTP